MTIKVNFSGLKPFLGRTVTAGLKPGPPKRFKVRRATEIGLVIKEGIQ